jgi:hypothetical protein
VSLCKRKIYITAVIVTMGCVLANCNHTDNSKYKLRSFTQVEVDNIINAYAKCWRIPVGSKVTVIVSLNPDASIKSLKLAEQDQILYNKDTKFKEVADSAKTAIINCSPNKSLPLDRYDVWKEIEITFDPRDMKP